MLQLVAFSAVAVMLATVKSQQYSSSNYCPQGGTPQYVSGMPATTLQVAQSCLSGSCSAGYTCQPSTFGGLPYCCSNSVSVSSNVYNNGYTNGYASNNNAYPSSSIYQNSGAYTATNNNLNSYTNRYNDNSNTAMSAQAQGNSNSYCPQGSQPQYVSGLPATTLQVPMSCSSSSGSCSAGYTCQLSYSGLSYCCSSSGSITSNGAYNTNNVYNNGNTNRYPTSTNNNNANSYTNSFATSNNPSYPSSSTNYQNTYNNLNNFNNRYNDNSGLYYVATTAYPTNYVTNSAYNAVYSQGYSNNGATSQYCPAGTTPYYYPNQHVPSCLVGISNCPYPSTCQSTPTSTVGAIGHCCNGNVG